MLGENEGAQALRRLRRHETLRELDLPIILLIGGATGTGKSTVATEVAYRLGITRVTSTDFVRQTMRAFLSPEFMPSIHRSSFEPFRDEDELRDVLGAFVDQTRNVLIGVRAVIDRALQEGWSLVLEGVHLVPGMLPKVEGALVDPLRARDRERGRARSRTSGCATRAPTASAPCRSTSMRCRDIRLIQDFVVEQARRASVPVVENSSIELSIATVMELVLSSAERFARV